MAGCICPAAASGFLFIICGRRCVRTGFVDGVAPPIWWAATAAGLLSPVYLSRLCGYGTVGNGALPAASSFHYGNGCSCIPTTYVSKLTSAYLGGPRHASGDNFLPGSAAAAVVGDRGCDMAW